MKTNLKKGFTLIELLVVIAIIGILSSVVLASLNTARAKGSDAAVKSNLNGIRAQAEIVYDGAVPNSYSGLCTQANIAAQLLGAKNASGATVSNNTYATAGAAATVTCHVNTANDEWAVESPLKSAPASFWCLDSQGTAASTSGSTLGISDTRCN